MLSTPNLLDSVLFGISALLLLQSLFRWFSAKPRTKYHNHFVMVAGGLVLIQVKSFLTFGAAGTMVMRGLCFAVIVFAIWYGSGLGSTSKA